jgi:glycosyltransferase involved in cell wall biosynthesis
MTEDVRDELLRFVPAVHDRCVIIPNPIDAANIELRMNEEPSPAALPSGFINLVAAGRLTPPKGFDILIEAVAMLGNTRVRVSILGEGPLEAELRTLAQQKGIADQIAFVGFQANPYPWFAHADAFILSSRYEGMPNVVLEALACGTRVIATPASEGVREILCSIAGSHIADEISASALVAVIRKAIEQAPLAHPRPDLSRYHISHVIRQYERVLR